VIRRKHYSIRTEQSYLDWIRRLILFHGKRHPAQMAEAEVTGFFNASGAGWRSARFHTKPSTKCAAVFVQRSAQAGAWLARPAVAPYH
jgi:hypothetical protein